MNVGLDSARPNSSVACVKCASQLQLINFAIIQLLLVTPAARNDSTDQVRKAPAGRGWRCGIAQDEQKMEPFPNQFNRQNPRCPLGIKRAFEVGHEIVLLEARLKLLQLSLRPAVFSQSFPDRMGGDLQAGDA